MHGQQNIKKLKEYHVRRPASIESGWGQLADPCDEGNKFMFHEGQEYLVQLRGCGLFKRILFCGVITKFIDIPRSELFVFNTCSKFNHYVRDTKNSMQCNFLVPMAKDTVLYFIVLTLRPRNKPCSYARVYIGGIRNRISMSHPMTKL
jgi:hypothetical protein